MAQAFQSQVISLACEGVFERFPGLRVVLMEGGFAWLPSLMWRLDQALEAAARRSAAPKAAAVGVHQGAHWATTQPMEEPTTEHLLQVMEHLGIRPTC